jgi:hypothetical protein
VEQPNIKVAAPIVNMPEIKMPEIKIPEPKEPKPRVRKIKRDPQTQRMIEIVEE